MWLASAANGGALVSTLWIRPMGEGTSIILIEEIERVTHRLICYFRKIRGSNAYSVVCDIGSKKK